LEGNATKYEAGKLVTLNKVCTHKACEIYPITHTLRITHTCLDGVEVWSLQPKGCAVPR
jgi:hypothetical protein